LKILTSIGEMGVTVGTRTVKFRPSLYAMAQLGSPTEIVELFNAVCGIPPLTGTAWVDEPALKAWRREQLRGALTVLYCCTEEDIGWLIGGVTPRMRYSPGVLPMSDIIGLAIGLLKHGLLGDLPREKMKRGKDTHSNEFVARDFVAQAMAHLGLNESEAWEMTMTAYIGAMRAKYPPQEDAKPAASAEDFDHVSGWLARVNQARKAANHG
jgi:post-segregation antitoxin (ccd killing protein)